MLDTLRAGLVKTRDDGSAVVDWLKTNVAARVSRPRVVCTASAIDVVPKAAYA